MRSGLLFSVVFSSPKRCTIIFGALLYPKYYGRGAAFRGPRAGSQTRTEKRQRALRRSGLFFSCLVALGGKGRKKCQKTHYLSSLGFFGPFFHPFPPRRSIFLLPAKRPKRRNMGNKRRGPPHGPYIFHHLFGAPRGLGEKDGWKI